MNRFVKGGVVIGALCVGISTACGPVDRRPTSGTGAAADTLYVEPTFTVGLEDGDPDYLFGAVTAVAADSEGRVYVGDRIGATVRAYDVSGTFLSQLAREGEGPGEIYGWPADLTTDSDGRLWVRDGKRITVFERRTPTGLPDSVAFIWPLPGYGNLGSTRSMPLGDGRYLYPNYLFRFDEHPRYFYLPFVAGSTSGDTLEVPAYPGLTGLRSASYRMSASGGRMLRGLSHVPFAPLPSWAVTRAGTLLSTDGSAYRILETGLAGDTIRWIDGPTDALRPVPPAELRDSTRALTTRLDTLPVPIDDVIGLGDGVREARLPETLPPIIGLFISTDGSILAERWPAEGRSGSRFYDVLDAAGRLQHTVVLNAAIERDPPPFFGTGIVVGVLRDQETGVERVVVFGIPSAQVLREGRR